MRRGSPLVIVTSIVLVAGSVSSRLAAASRLKPTVTAGSERRTSAGTADALRIEISAALHNVRIAISLLRPAQGQGYQPVGLTAIGFDVPMTLRSSVTMAVTVCVPIEFIVSDSVATPLDSAASAGRIAFRSLLATWTIPV